MPERFIPEQIDPFRYAEQSLSLAGTVKLSNMPRLRDYILPSEERVAVDLEFGIDEQGISFLKGHLSTKLGLQCQRCMEPFPYEIISDFALGIVHTLEEADALPKHYEPAVTVEGNLLLRDLIEDEVILNLPIVPKHASEDCKIKLPYADTAEEQDKSKNPFHVLQSLKDK